MTRKLIITLVAGAVLCGAGPVAMPATAMPINGLALANGLGPTVQTVSNYCERWPCWPWYPSYYDTPMPLRPRVFYGYEPHRHGDMFDHLYGWDGRYDRRPIGVQRAPTISK